MDVFIARIDDEKIQPTHSHSYWEIMYYLSGEGYISFEKVTLPFSKGTVAIIPPNTVHSLVSEHGFEKICIRSSTFDYLLLLDEPAVLEDNANKEGELLATLIYNNRYGNKEYLSSLCQCYVHFLLQSIKTASPAGGAVEKIVDKMEKEFADPFLSASQLLEQSGYAPDYIRAVFKEITGKTPVEFLSNVRLDYAGKMLEIYGGSLSVEEIATMSGYTDSAYFSKQFKRKFGVSPQRYKKI